MIFKAHKDTEAIVSPSSHSKVNKSLKSIIYPSTKADSMTSLSSSFYMPLQAKSKDFGNSSLRRISISKQPCCEKFMGPKKFFSLKSETNLPASKEMDYKIRQGSLPVQPSPDHDEPSPEEEEVEELDEKERLKVNQDLEESLSEDNDSEKEAYLDDLHINVINKMKDLWIKQSGLSEQKFYSTMKMQLPEKSKPSFEELAGFVTAKIYYEKAARSILSKQGSQDK